MIHNAKFVLRRRVAEYGTPYEFILYGICFKKRPNKNFYEGFYKHFLIMIYERRIVISNALGGGRKDITYTQLCEIVNDLCCLLKCEPDELLITIIEFGFSLEIEFAPQVAMRRIIMANNTEPQKSRRKKRIRETVFKYTYYSFKLYDDVFVENSRNRKNEKGNRLRIEMRSKRSHFKDLAPIRTAADLLQHENLEQLYCGFIGIWRVIRKAPIMNLEAMERKDQNYIYARLNPLYWSDMQKVKSVSAIKKAQDRFFNERLPKCGDYFLFYYLEELCEKKFRHLMEN